MPGKYEVTIDGETWELEPPRGLASMRKMPKVISFISKLVFSASRAGFDIRSWLSEENEMPELGLEDVLRLINYIAVALDDNFDEFEKEIAPFLLQRDYEWLEEHGSPVELFNGIVVGIRMVVGITTGEQLQAALKKSQPAAEVEME